MRRIKSRSCKSRPHRHKKQIRVRRVVHDSRTHGDLMFHIVADEWIRSITPQLKESTIATYQHKLHKHIDPFFGKKRISQIKVQDINNFVNYELSNNLSKRYISYMIRMIKSIFKYAKITYGIKDITDEVSILAKEKSGVHVISDHEQVLLISYITENPGLTSLAVALSVFAGLRIGEICALQWKDIDLNEKLIYVTKTIQRIQCNDSSQKTKLTITAPKSSSSNRIIPLPPCLYDMLMDYTQEPELYIISQSRDPVEPRTLQYRFAHLLSCAGLKHVRFHALRHMFASNAVAMGFDVKALSEILGHSSANITLDTYVHSSIETKRAYMNMIGSTIS